MRPRPRNHFSLKGSIMADSDKGENAYTVPDSDLLPRYKFTPTGVGCETHKDPICLCDIQMPAQPSNVLATGLTFGALTTQIMGPPTKGNIAAWASLLLGMADAEKQLTTPNTAGGNGHTGNGTPWTDLPDTVRAKMAASYRERTPWSVAKVFLPETLSAADMKYLAKYYNQRLYSKTTAKPATTKESTQ